MEILKISIFGPKIILKISKNDQISEPDQIFERTVQEFNEELFELTKDNGHKSRRVILIEGEPGIGKTRFLNEVSFSVNESNHIAVFATITITERNKNYSVVKMCIYLLLKLNLCETRKERQTKLIELVEKYGNQDENGNIVINNLESDLHLLNDVLGLSFPTPAGYRVVLVTCRILG